MKRKIKVEIKKDGNHFALLKCENHRKNEVAVCEHEWDRPIINANNYQCSKCGIWKKQTDL